MLQRSEDLMLCMTHKSTDKTNADINIAASNITADHKSGKGKGHPITGHEGPEGE